MLSAGSSKHNIPDTGDPQIAGSEIWFGKISRAGFQILFHFFDLLLPRSQYPATKLAIDSQTTEKTKRQQKFS
jgi:hypothetical protein